VTPEDIAEARRLSETLNAWLQGKYGTRKPTPKRRRTKLDRRASTRQKSEGG